MSELFNESEITATATLPAPALAPALALAIKKDKMSNPSYLYIQNLWLVSIVMHYNSIVENPPWWLPFKNATHTISTIIQVANYVKDSRIVIVLVLKSQYKNLERLLNSQDSMEGVEALTNEAPNGNGIIYNSRAKFCLDNYFSRQPIIGYNYKGIHNCINIDISCTEEVVMVVYNIVPFHKHPIWTQFDLEF